MKRTTLAIIAAGSITATVAISLFVFLRTPLPVRQLQNRAKSGNPAAQFALAKLYASGAKGIPKNPAAAAQWYSQAADSGYAKAQNNLAVMYANGEGVPKDEAKAFQLFLKAALQGDTAAETHLGVIYLRGTGVPQNYDQSVSWFRKAAEQNNWGAQDALALEYAAGIGVRRDPVMSLAWFLVAQAQASTEAKNKGKNEAKNEVEKQIEKVRGNLSPAQVSEAQTLATAWWSSRQKGRSDTMPEHSRTAVGRPSRRSSASTPHEPPALSFAEPGSLGRRARTGVGTSDCESGHFILSVSDDGTVVILEDRSVWRISDVDAITSVLWLPSEDIVVCEGKLINTDDGETVEASRLR